MNLLRKFTPQKKIALTLIELLISIILMGLIILSIYSVDIFSRHQVTNSDMRARVQNEISNVIEHMNKYVQQAIGNKDNPAIKLYPNSAPFTGFQARVDFNNPQTPGNLTDDAWVSYSLEGVPLALKTKCTPVGAGSCGSFSAEDLSRRIISGFDNSTMPVNPDKGFYAAIGDGGSLVDVGISGRYKPGDPASQTNPQVNLATRIICSSCSAN